MSVTLDFEELTNTICTMKYPLLYDAPQARKALRTPWRSVEALAERERGTQTILSLYSQTLKTKEIPHRADHHPCVLFPVAFTTTNLNSNT